MLNITCLTNFKCLKKCRFNSAWLHFVQGVLRIFLSGYLEILLCSVIGLEMLNLETKLTQVDEYTVIVNFVYLVGLAIFCLLISWFVFWRMRVLVIIKQTRDILELLKLFRIIK